MIVLKVFLRGGLFLLLLGDFCSSKLHCWRCSSVRDHDNCDTLWFQNNKYSHALQHCQDGEVCVKNVKFYERVLPNGTRISEKRFQRGCFKYDPQKGYYGTLGKCVYRGMVSGPGDYPSLRCLCNNTNYCNGSINLSTRDTKTSIILICATILIITNFLLQP